MKRRAYHIDPTDIDAPIGYWIMAAGFFLAAIVAVLSRYLLG